MPKTYDLLAARPDIQLRMMLETKFYFTCEKKNELDQNFLAFS